MFHPRFERESREKGPKMRSLILISSFVDFLLLFVIVISALIGGISRGPLFPAFMDMEWGRISLYDRIFPAFIPI
jgi:hypothetical protein